VAVIPPSLLRLFSIAWLGLALIGPVRAGSDNAPIIQPGAPGEPGRELSAEEAIEIANTGFSPDDVKFMHDMIPHHHQALEMSALVADRTNNPELIDVAGRINGSQGDEIEFMQQWLRERGQHVPDPQGPRCHAHLSQDGRHGHTGTDGRVGRGTRDTL
jgi:hypothetical protein